MRQRITFIHEPNDGIDPSELVVTSTTFKIPKLRAAREDRITIGRDEIDSGVWELIEKAGDMTVKAVRPLAYSTIPPFSSRMPFGVSFTSFSEPSSEPYVDSSWRMILY